MSKEKNNDPISDKEFEEALLRQSAQVPGGFNPLDFIRRATAENQALNLAPQNNPAQTIQQSAAKNPKKPVAPVPQVAPAQPAKIKPPEKPSVALIRWLYDESFDALYERKTKGSILSKLVDFRRKNVLWSELRGETYHSLETGPRPAGYLVVVPPGHRVRRLMGDSVVRLPSDENMVLQINPVAMTEPWPAVLLTFGLALLYARTSGMETKNVDRAQYFRTRAFANIAEMDAMNHYTDGAFKKLLEDLIKKYGMADFKSFRNFMNDRKVFEKEMAQLENMITPERPLNQVELGARKGFLTMALGLMVASTSAMVSGKDGLEEITAFIEKIETATGQNRHMPKK